MAGGWREEEARDRRAEESSNVTLTTNLFLFMAPAPGAKGAAGFLRGAAWSIPSYSKFKN
eukprot:1239043-Rhodomonas_salina.1